MLLRIIGWYLEIVRIGAPPSPGLPDLHDGILAGLAALGALALPSVWLALRCHQRLGHWQRYFAYWRHRSWWAIMTGSLGASAALWILLGVLPGWNYAWARWDAQAAAAHSPAPTMVQWLDQIQNQFALLIQVSAMVILVGSLALLALGGVLFTRRVLTRRIAPQPTADWMMPSLDP